MNKYTPEDILSRLQAGETIDSLAQEFTEALNTAKALQEEEAKNAEAEALVACQRREAMSAIVAAMENYILNFGTQEQQEYFADYYPSNEDLDRLCDSVDSMLELAMALEGISKLTFPLQKVEEGKKEDCACGKCRPAIERKKEVISADKAIADFLSHMGW